MPRWHPCPTVLTFVHKPFNPEPEPSPGRGALDARHEFRPQGDLKSPKGGAEKLPMLHVHCLGSVYVIPLAGMLSLYIVDPALSTGGTFRRIRFGIHVHDTFGENKYSSFGFAFGGTYNELYNLYKPQAY